MMITIKGTEPNEDAHEAPGGGRGRRPGPPLFIF